MVLASIKMLHDLSISGVQLHEQEQNYSNNTLHKFTLHVYEDRYLRDSSYAPKIGLTCLPNLVLLNSGCVGRERGLFLEF